MSEFHLNAHNIQHPQTFFCTIYFLLHHNNLVMHYLTLNKK